MFLLRTAKVVARHSSHIAPAALSGSLDDFLTVVCPSSAGSKTV